MKKQIRKFLLSFIKRNNKNKKINDNIPDNILMIYGKFYFYSVAYMIIFGLFYPLLVIHRVSVISLVLSIVVLVSLYIYMIIDVIKKTKGFKSGVFSLFILLVILCFSFCIIKIFI